MKKQMEDRENALIAAANNEETRRRQLDEELLALRKTLSAEKEEKERLAQTLVRERLTYINSTKVTNLLHRRMRSASMRQKSYAAIPFAIDSMHLCCCCW